MPLARLLFTIAPKWRACLQASHFSEAQAKEKEKDGLETGITLTLGGVEIRIVLLAIIITFIYTAQIQLLCAVLQFSNAPEWPIREGSAREGYFVQACGI